MITLGVIVDCISPNHFHSFSIAFTVPVSLPTIFTTNLGSFQTVSGLISVTFTILTIFAIYSESQQLNLY